MQFFSYTAVFASACLLTTVAGYSQSQGGLTPEAGSANFYVTTPQTGQQTIVGERPGTGGAPSPASDRASSVNTYLSSPAVPQTARAERLSSRAQTQKAEATANRGYSIQQVSNSPRQLTAPMSNSNFYMQPNQAPQTAVSTSAQSARAQQPVTATKTTYPAYVSNAGDTSRKGVFSRILYSSDGTARANPLRQVSSLASRTGHSVSMQASRLAGSIQQGMASWYGKDFDGGKTANGERYDMDSMTAAHKSLPFGTLVKVQNERNGRECVVRINNRGPFTKGRILDLSRAAAHQLDMMGAGVAKIKMEVVGRS